MKFGIFRRNIVADSTHSLPRIMKIIVLISMKTFSLFCFFFHIHMMSVLQIFTLNHSCCYLIFNLILKIYNSAINK